MIFHLLLFLGKGVGRLKHFDKLVDLVKVVRGELRLVMLDHFLNDDFHAFDALPLLLQFGVDDVLASSL